MADYDPAINPLTGQPVSRFADGGIARYNGEDGSSVQTSFGYPNTAYMDPAYGYAHDPVRNAMSRSRMEGLLNGVQNNQGGKNTPESEKDLKVRAMAMAGDPKYDPRYMPLRLDDRPMNPIQAALLRLQAQKQMGDGEARAGISGLAAALPGERGVRGMPGAYDVGYNTPVGPGNLDISAYRAMKAMPNGQRPYGVNARYSIPFNQGGIAHFDGETGSQVEESPFEVPKGFFHIGSKVVGQDSETGAGGQKRHLLQDDKGGVLTVNADGSPVDYIPGQSWYKEQYKAHPDAVRKGYRNMEYLAAGPLDDTIDINGQKVDINKTFVGENLVDTKSGKLLTDQSGNYVPIYNDRNKSGGFDSFMETAIPLAIAVGAAGTGLGAAGLIGPGAALGSTAGGGGFGISAVPGASSTLGTLTAPGAAGTTFGITGGALGTGVPVGLTVPTTGALVGGAGGAGITAKQALAAKMAMDMMSGGGGQGGQPSAGPSSTTSYIPFNPGQGNTMPTYNPTSANPFASMNMTSKGNYGFDPLLYNYGINPRRGMAAGGIAELAAGGGTNLGSYSDGGHLLKGPGDGMSDHIPATIGGQQPARLAEGEFVVPADVVSHLGNGSTDAGAKQLYKMMDQIRKARTGNAKQGKQINPNKFFPKG
jgi:hypothetical protein